MHKNSDKNPAIKCNVFSCANHNESEEYCALGQIQVGTHEAEPRVQECTDCQSFEKK